MTLLLNLVIGLGVTTGPPAPALYPIPPRPLRQLVHEAEFIVTARVEAADPRCAKIALAEVPEWLGPQSVVTLVIDGLVKGDPGVRALEQVNFGYACPAPAYYLVGKRVLAFLDRAEEGPGFYTHALSYGAKTLGDADLDLYMNRIREQLAIEKIPEGDARLAAQIEWLVKCAEHQATRWEGAYELCPTGDFFSLSNENAPPPDFAQHLSTTQRTRLREALLDAKGFGTGERCLEKLMRDDPDPRLEAWLVARLRANGDTLDEFELTNLVDCIARRDDRPAVRERVNACKVADRAARGAAVRALASLFGF